MCASIDTGRRRRYVLNLTLCKLGKQVRRRPYKYTRLCSPMLRGVQLVPVSASVSFHLIKARASTLKFMRQRACPKGCGIGLSSLRINIPHSHGCVILSGFAQLEACGRLLCCVQRLCRSGSAADEPAEHRINARGRRGARAESELVEGQGPSGPEDGMLAMPVSPSPASTSSQEDACKPPPRNCYRLVMLGSARVGKTAIVAR